MKTFFKIFFLFSLLFIVFIFKDSISNYILDNYIYKDYKKKEITYNSYYKSNNYLYLQNVTDYVADDRQDILNIIYTIINSGEDSFIFSCSKEYQTCKDDVDAIAHDAQILSNINNFVNPYNTFKTISMNVGNVDNIRVSIVHIYSLEETIYVNNFIKSFIDSFITDNMSNYDKIKVFHDYIINNTAYDEIAASLINTDIKTTNTAYTLLLNNKSICSGYSDILAIYLDYLGITNYRISSLNHIWNLVYINDGWYHIDLTWDDPVTNTKEQLLLYDYFIINTNTLLSLDQTEHNFDKTVFLEAN